MTRFFFLALLIRVCLCGAEAAEPTRLEVRAERPAASGYGVYGLSEWHVSLPENAAPTTLADWLALQLGVSVDGQGGWQQTLNIRGATGQRVQMILEGVPINTERRAGTALHFIDPVWLKSVSVLSGASSTVFGAGGAAVVQTELAEWEGWRAHLSTASEADARREALAWSNGETSFGIARTEQSNSRSAGGLLINDHGERQSALLRHRFTLAGGDAELLWLPSTLTDVGRANADFYLNRITHTPKEKHAPLRLSWRHGDWEAALFEYASEVTTVVDRIGVDWSETRNQARDQGFSVHHFGQIDHWRWRVGADGVQRRDVDAKETLIDRKTHKTQQRLALDSGADQLLGVFAEADGETRDWLWQAALRHAWQTQSVAATPEAKDSGSAAHLGASWRLGEAWQLRAGAGSAWRFPSLSERFYNGVTPRGDLRGNPQLKAEQSRDLEWALSWASDDLRLEAVMWRRDFENYIERVVINSRLRSYGNRDEGRLQGVDALLGWQLNSRWHVQLRSGRMQGEDQKGVTLADVAPEQSDLQAQWKHDGCELSFAWHWRRNKAKVGPEELPLASADWGSLKGGCAVNTHLHWRLQLDNAGDADFRMSADDQSAWAPGRRWMLSLDWR